MTLITSLPLKGSIVGTEEFVINYSGTDYKVTAAQIVAAINTALDAEIATTDAEITTLQNTKLALSGGTLTGNLVLANDPIANLHPATKQWVEAQLASKADAVGQSFDATTTGVTAANTSESTALATTEFVANKLEYELLRKTVINNPTTVLAETDRGTIIVKRTTLSVVSLTLPTIASLTSADRVEYTIVDGGDNAATNNITITAGGTDTINGAASYVISRDSGAISICNTGGTEWFVKNVVYDNATETSEGVMEIATTAEAQALTDTTRSITPSTAGDIIDNSIYKRTEITTATYSAIESESGILAVKRTASGVCTITLPQISTLSNPDRVRYIIVDEGLNALVNNITITAGGTDTISDGFTNYIIGGNGQSLTLTNNGADKWFISSAYEEPYFSGVHAYLTGNQTLSNAAWETVVFDGTELNSQGQYDTGTGKFTPRWSSYYTVEATVYFDVNATGVRGVRIIEDAGGDKIRATTIISSYATYNPAITVYAMFASDNSSTIRVEAFQTSTAGLDVIGGALTDSHFRVIEK